MESVVGWLVLLAVAVGAFMLGRRSTAAYRLAIENRNRMEMDLEQALTANAELRAAVAQVVNVQVDASRQGGAGAGAVDSAMVGSARDGFGVLGGWPVPESLGRVADDPLAVLGARQPEAVDARRRGMADGGRVYLSGEDEGA